MNQTNALLIGGGAAALALLILAKNPAAASTVGNYVGSTAVNMFGGVSTGVIDSVSTAVGIPTTAETLTDVQSCKRYMDENGVWAASFHCGAPAFIGALTA